MNNKVIFSMLAGPFSNIKKKSNSEGNYFYFSVFGIKLLKELCLCFGNPDQILYGKDCFSHNKPEKAVFQTAQSFK